MNTQERYDTELRAAQKEMLPRCRGCGKPMKFVERGITTSWYCTTCKDGQ